MDNNTPQTPGPSGGLPDKSPVEDVIPPVVAASQGSNRLMIGGFLAFMGLLAVFVCRKSKPASGLPEKEVVAAGPLLPPVAATSPVPVQMVFARSLSQHSGEEALWAVRRRSPMIIFSSSNGGNRADGSGMTGISVLGPTSLESLSGAAGAPSGAPLPHGFSPSAAASAYATSLGDREYLMAQGKLIDAVLETSISSDHPGMARALVSHDIYGDSGRTVLLPRGSRLVGQYDSAISKGQNRVFVLWQRAIRPDGIDVQLGSAGTDPLGGTGIEGQVNYHFWAMFGAATLLSVIGSAASTVGVNPADQNNSLAQYRDNVTNGFNSAAGTVLGQFVQIKPTITVRQGVTIKVFVARDLYFDPAILAGNDLQVIP